jgi:hypothetical protein
MLQALIAHEGVIQLAKQINNFSGLFPSKRIIVVRADDRFIVVEGNRRVSACKLLLKPWLAVHTELEQQIPIIDERTRENLNNVPVIVAATRAVADEVVANLHLAGGKREWSDIGQILLANHLSRIEEEKTGKLPSPKLYRYGQGSIFSAQILEQL